MAPVARALADRWRVLEPFQRASGGEPLTVARHVEDLRELFDERCPGERPAVVGSSWGAMLALAFAADYPDRAGALVLIGCGTYDRAARARMREIRAERADPALMERVDRALAESGDDDTNLRAVLDEMLLVDAFDPVTTDLEVASIDAESNRETWADMIRLQKEGVYPAAFARITIPVLMLHGDFDPHPGAMIRDSLLPYLPQLEYREWARCGHYPWIERAVRAEFFAVLRAWLEKDSTNNPSTADV
jgi:pimeloyl-ACP methyl ester carboxylesterase